jgi:uncharacterized membrane protein
MFVGAPVVAVAWILTVIGWVLTRRRSDRMNRLATWWSAWLLGGVLVVVVGLAAFTAW